jgi:hypothetical protein
MRPWQQRRIARRARTTPYYGNDTRRRGDVFAGSIENINGALYSLGQQVLRTPPLGPDRGQEYDEHPLDARQWLGHLGRVGDYFGRGTDHFRVVRETQMKNWLDNFIVRALKWANRARLRIPVVGALIPFNVISYRERGALNGPVGVPVGTWSERRRI